MIFRESATRFERVKKPNGRNNDRSAGYRTLAKFLDQHLNHRWNGRR